MIAVDTNVLIYAHREELPRHSVARDRLVSLAEGDAPWAIPVFCVGEFVRVITHPRLFAPAHSAQEACEALERLLASPGVRLLNPGSGYATLLKAAILESGATGNIVFDAQIVAVCRENGVSALLTEDRDFDRFARFPTRRLT